MHALKKLFFSRGHIIYVGDDARVRDHYLLFQNFFFNYIVVNYMNYIFQCHLSRITSS